MKLRILLMAGLMTVGFAFSANAGAVADADGDQVPDAFDNCVNDANGPLTVPANNQTNLDGDAFGVRCDPDYDQNGTVGVGDFTVFFSAFSADASVPGSGVGVEPRTDHDQNGAVGVGDFTIFFAKFTAGFPG